MPYHDFNNLISLISDCQKQNTDGAYVVSTNDDVKYCMEIALDKFPTAKPIRHGKILFNSSIIYIMPWIQFKQFHLGFRGIIKSSHRWWSTAQGKDLEEFETIRVTTSPVKVVTNEQR